MNALSRLLPALSLAALGSLHAAPSNDNLAASTELFAGAAAVTTTNLGATLEPGEAQPVENYNSSIWYHFKPVFSGWYEVTTAGSTVPTVLSIYTASDDVLSPVHSSAGRIQFNAGAGTTYKIAVASSGEQGGLSLQAFYIPGPFAKVIAASFEQTAVDITSGTASSKATLTIEASRELAEGTFNVVSPGGLTVASVPFSAANRVSGCIAQGVYEVSFNLPQHIAAGGYAWNLSVANNAVGKLTSQGRGALTPANDASSSTLAVVNNGVVDGYAQWAAANGGGELASLVGGTTSLEGSLSLGNYAFGMSGSGSLVVKDGSLVRPGAPSIGTTTGANGKKHLRVEFSRLRNSAQQGVSYRVQFSDDLSTWEDATTPEQTFAANGTYEAVAVEDSIATTDAPRRFARVLVERSVP